MYQDLINIDLETGLDGLLPQNLPDDLLHELVEAIQKLSEDNLQPEKLAGIERMFVNVHTDTSNSIMYYGKTFKYKPFYQLTYEEFNELFKIVRFRIVAEMLRRETGRYIVDELPTPENLLQPVNID